MIDRHFYAGQEVLICNILIGRACGRIGNVLKSVISGWFAETDKANFVDKNRGWLRMAEMLNILKKLVPRGRIELPTSSLPMMRSTTELPRHFLGIA